MAASPDFKNSGLPSSFSPERPVFSTLAALILAWMVQDCHLSCETSCFHWWVIFAVTSHIATKNIFDRHVLEGHVVPRRAITQSIMVHFKRLSCLLDWSKVTTLPGLRTPVFDPQGQYQYHQFCRHLGRAKTRAYQLGKLVAGCSLELQAVWFNGHCHLYG